MNHRRLGSELKKPLQIQFRESQWYSRINYEDVISAKPSEETPFTLPHLILETKTDKIKFRLIHSNYQGRGKLPDDVFSSYRATSFRAFGQKLTVSRKS